MFLAVRKNQATLSKLQQSEKLNKDGTSENRLASRFRYSPHPGVSKNLLNYFERICSFLGVLALQKTARNV